MQSIGTILLGQSLQSSLKSSFLTDSSIETLALSVPVQVASIDELWFKISANLESRKKSPAVVVEPPVISTRPQSSGPRVLAEELCMTETLIDNLAEQLRIAGLIQRDFLPAKLPSTNQLQWEATFMPAEWVSGDIYDVTRVDEQHIGFYVADVVGHGIPAAILTIFLKQALTMRQTLKNSYVIFPPAEVMKNLNTRMTDQKLSGYQFATCCYCLLNTKTLRLTYSRAGHPYPILIRAGSQPQQLQTQGPLLGIFKQAEYVQQSVQLQPGDKLLLYSDGAEPFIGAFDEQANFNFYEQFREIKGLPVVELVDKFNTLTQNKTLDPVEVDDITMLGLEIL
jgi:sigma-B regulation protein RsbU (phosphoserine phosphatase)